MRNATKISLIVLSVIVALLGIAVGFFFLMIDPTVNIMNAPNLDEARLTSYSRTVKILDCNDNVIDDALLYDNGKYYVTIDELSENTVNAFIAIEDKRFYSHKGIDYKRAASALLSDIKSRSFREGASTITQQLIKNTHLSNEKTIKRKISEMRLARQLEKRYSKEQILESYFNILYFGSGINGLGTASRVMFGKPASELTLAQSAALAAIINNPSKYSPYNNPDNLERRKQTVLSRMLEQNFITQTEYDDACAEALEFAKNQQSQFIKYVLKSACHALGCSEKQLFAGNYTIKTSFNQELSQDARAVIGGLDANYTVRILVLDNQSGGIVCDETNTDTVINARRSPASTIKPFIAYAPALEQGYNPLSQILDEPTSFGDYSPQNYKNIYRGYQSLTDGLIRSSNIAAVKLVNDVGLDYCKIVAQKFGLPSSANDGLSVALGGMEHGVTLDELANAYRTLANGGVYSACEYIAAVYSGYNISEYKISNAKSIAIGDDTAYLLTDMLKACAKRGTAKALANSGIIAAKTGTNGDDRGNTDCYCVAYTPQYTIAVWFGADENLINNSVTGASCTKIIKQLIDYGNINTSEEFTMPDSVGYYEVDAHELNSSHEVYLASPLLPKRYCMRALLSKKHLPIRKSLDIVDYFDNYFWDNNIYGVDFPE